MQELDTSRIRTLFDAHGVRCTRQREEVYFALASVDTHPTAEELFNQVRRAQPGISLATVYNALETFTTHGLCRKVVTGATPDSAGAPCRYDAVLDDHIHLVTPDGRVQDVPGMLSEELLSRIPSDLVRRIETRMGVRIGRLSINLIADGPAESRKDAGVDVSPGEDAGTAHG